MQYLSSETFSLDKKLLDMQDDFSKLEGSESRSLSSDIAKLDSLDAGCYESLHARYASSRRLKRLFFEEHILVGPPPQKNLLCHDESCWVCIQ